MIEGCFHIYNIDHAAKLFSKFGSVINGFDRLLVSVPVGSSKNVTAIFAKLDLQVPVEVIEVENTYNDWTGYLALLRASKTDKLMFCNDSVINRRIVLGKDISKLTEMLSRSAGPSLIGELDTAKHSVPVNGRASICWVSSYLFGLNLSGMSANDFADALEAGCETLTDETRSHFVTFLKARRGDLLSAAQAPEGKIRAMHLERLMMDFAAQNGFEVVSQYGGDWNRKVRKLIETKFY